jgi:hypothetical protein
VAAFIADAAGSGNGGFRGRRKAKIPPPQRPTVHLLSGMPAGRAPIVCRLAPVRRWIEAWRVCDNFDARLRSDERSSMRDIQRGWLQSAFGLFPCNCQLQNRR